MTRLLIVHFVEFHPFQIGRSYSAIREAILLPPRRLAPACALRSISCALRLVAILPLAPTPSLMPSSVLFSHPNGRNMLHRYLENYFVFRSSYFAHPCFPSELLHLIRSNFRI